MMVEDNMNRPIVWVADVGSIKMNKFGWCRATSEITLIQGTDIVDFADGIANDLSSGNKVALGFECPLFVPVSNNPVQLTSARMGEGNKPWSAGAGCGALTVGLTECAWVFERLRQTTTVRIIPTFKWDEFAEGQANLLIWEAFVTGKSKASSHKDDAGIAAKTFWSRYPNISSDVTAENPYSLVGAALLRAGLTSDLQFLFEQCIALKSL